MGLIVEDRDGVIDLRERKRKGKEEEGKGDKRVNWGRGRCRMVLEGMGEEFKSLQVDEER